MKKITYSIDPQVFSIAPMYARALIIIKNIQNTPSTGHLREKLTSIQKHIASTITQEQLLSDIRIKSWQEVFRKTGMNPRDTRPAHEAMLRRIVQDKLIPSINTIVDVGNICSFEHMIPIGVHPLDSIKSELVLRQAVGTETFTPFNVENSDLVEHPMPGEIVLCEGDTVLTRSWVWRQSKGSITHVETKNLVINIDVLQDNLLEAGIGSKESALQIANELSVQVKELCGGDSEICILHASNPKVEFTV
ncbi:MAG: hypothetical protein RIQ72_668 [Candidatus Parcubacteria bacterium]|jgi:DNA/RNA-binding domain of Phe-tRNA-synthetase-like protein